MDLLTELKNMKRLGLATAMVRRDKQRNILDFSERFPKKKIEGAYAEIGVWRGGSAYLISSALVAHRDPRTFICCDTFEGLPSPSTEDNASFFQKGRFGDVDFRHVKFVLEGLREGTQVIKGLFPGAFGPYAGLSYAFVHVDVDLYQSVRDCCEFFWPLMVPGGLMLFDDYGTWQCPGAKKAVDEFFGTAVEPLPAKHAIVRKAI